MTNPTPSELALEKAALKVAAEKCRKMVGLTRATPDHKCMAEACAAHVERLDPAAIVASVPNEQPEAAQDERERSDAWQEQFMLERGYPPSLLDIWQAAKRDALTQAPQHSSVLQLSELLRGLECGPALATESPACLYQIGAAIATQAKRAAQAPQGFDAEFLSKRLARVAKLIGYPMPDMTHEQIAEVAGTILGGIAGMLERAAQAPQEDEEAEFAQHWAVAGFVPEGANPDHIYEAMKCAWDARALLSQSRQKG